MLRRSRLAVAIISATAISAGCTTTKVEYQLAPLSLPPRPELPSISAEQLECLGNDTYESLVTRQRLRRQYTEGLELIIKSTWGAD